MSYPVQFDSAPVEPVGFFQKLFFPKNLSASRGTGLSCGIFDVSHMGEFIVSGEGAAEFLNEIRHKRMPFKNITKEVCEAAGFNLTPQ